MSQRAATAWELRSRPTAASGRLVHCTFQITIISRTECIELAMHERALIIVTCQASHVSATCAVQWRRAVSQNINSLPQMTNQQFSADGEAAMMSPRHLDHFELRTEVPPRPAVVFSRVKTHGQLERCRKIVRH